LQGGVAGLLEGLEETLGNRDFLVASFSNADIADLSG
jgi:hypothetical protein